MQMVRTSVYFLAVLGVACGGDPADLCVGDLVCTTGGSDPARASQHLRGASCIVSFGTVALQLQPDGMVADDHGGVIATGKRAGGRLSLETPSAATTTCEEPALAVAPTPGSCTDGEYVCENNGLYRCVGGALQLETSCNSCKWHGYLSTEYTHCHAIITEGFTSRPDTHWAGPGCYFGYELVCGLSGANSTGDGSSQGCRGSGHFCGTGAVCCSGYCDLSSNTCS